MQMSLHKFNTKEVHFENKGLFFFFFLIDIAARSVSSN